MVVGSISECKQDAGGGKAAARRSDLETRDGRRGGETQSSSCLVFVFDRPFLLRLVGLLILFSTDAHEM